MKKIADGIQEPVVEEIVEKPTNEPVVEVQKEPLNEEDLVKYGEKGTIGSIVDVIESTLSNTSLEINMGDSADRFGRMMAHIAYNNIMSEKED